LSRTQISLKNDDPDLGGFGGWGEIGAEPRRLSPDLVAARYALLEPRGEGVAFVEMSDSDYFAFLRRHTERPQKEEFHFPVRGPRLIVPAPNPLEG
jgi:hypothetical protein